MKFVVPVSSSDVDKLKNWLNVIVKFGNLANHGVALLPTIGAQEEAQEALNTLVENGIQAEIIQMPVSPNSGWPRATNTMFFWAARHMIGQNQPWMWMELDCLPVRSNWADLLAGAYTNGGTRFLGCVVRTPWKDWITRKMAPSPEGRDDDMMCGCGIYPANMAKLEEVQPLMDDFMKGDFSPETGFDIWLRAVIKKYGRAHTNLIADKWNTANYTFENGNLTCKQLPRHDGITEGSQMMDIGGTTINPQAATVHGCKDDSLYNLIMGGLDLSLTYKVGPASQSTKTADFGQVFQQQTPSTEVAELKSEVSELKTLLQKALEKISAAPAAQSNVVPPVQSSIQSEGRPEEKESGAIHAAAPASGSGSGSTILDRLVELISSSPKKVRIHQASELLNVPINKLKKAIETPGSPVTSGALGWLSLSEAKV